MRPTIGPNGSPPSPSVASLPKTQEKAAKKKSKMAKTARRKER